MGSLICDCLDIIERRKRVAMIYLACPNSFVDRNRIGGSKRVGMLMYVPQQQEFYVKSILLSLRSSIVLLMTVTGMNILTSWRIFVPTIEKLGSQGVVVGLAENLNTIPKKKGIYSNGCA